MSHNDSNFYKPFVFVLGALLIFTAFIMFVANVWSPDSPDAVSYTHLTLPTNREV